MPPRSLYDLCKPRASVFDAARGDTVYDLSNLGEIDADAFFEENWITTGMKQLLTETFRRLEGRARDTSGAFLLSQSMGGGKTHNLLALGLLAKKPQLRERVMGDFCAAEGLGAVQVVAFTGRKAYTQFGIWGEIAQGLGKEQVFSHLYQPLRPPGANDWVTLLAGGPVLILLDELPPYFEAAQATKVGGTTLDVITTTALSNLLVAVDSGKLPNACVVMTDLSAAAYNMGQAAINAALRNLQLETQRTVTTIAPVQLNSDELYHILRTRLFERSGDAREVGEVAAAFGQAVSDANKADRTREPAAAMQASIERTYPFHPAIRDLYARFRDNPGFQQTRALIRIMRGVVRELWANEGERARARYIIGAHDLDFLSAEITGEIRNINSTFENAVAHDIATMGGDATAQLIDGALGGANAHDAATLMFLSSLSQAVDPTLGLDRGELFGMLAAPGRDLGSLTAAVDELQGRAWYLHATGTGKLYFRNVQNINALLESYVKQAMPEERETVLRGMLESMFRPITGEIYGPVAALPALDEVELQQGRTALLIFRPAPTALDEITEFWEEQPFKNRVLFLTADNAGYFRVLERAAYLRGIENIIKEFKGRNMAESDEQMIVASSRQSTLEGQFYIACREAFQQLYYPSKNGLTQLDVEFVYARNKFEAEDQIAQALRAVYKYTEDTSVDAGFARKIEDILWPAAAKDVAWSQIVTNAAANPAWPWHHPRALEDARSEMVARDQWRDLGAGFYEKGPFPLPSTGVDIFAGMRDNDSGEVTLRVKPKFGDVVLYAADGQVTESSPWLEGSELRTAALSVQFLCIDSSGKHETGEPATWTNSIMVKWRPFTSEAGRVVELQAIPRGSIRYTTDGSSPLTSGIPYVEPFPVPEDGCTLQAYAEEGGVGSGIERFTVPAAQEGGPAIDPTRPATYDKRLSRDSTELAYTFCEAAERRGATLAGVRIAASRHPHWLELNGDDELFFQAPQVREKLKELREVLAADTAGSVELTLEVSAIRTATGNDLLALLGDLKLQLDASGVRQ